METWTQEIQAGTAHKIQADDSQTLANKVLTLPEIPHNYQKAWGQGKLHETRKAYSNQLVWWVAFRLY